MTFLGLSQNLKVVLNKACLVAGKTWWPIRPAIALG